MKRVKAVLVSALAITTISAVASPGKAAPLPTNLAAMKAALDTPVVAVRYGGWRGGWGYRGWGGRGWGYGGYRGWSPAAAGAVVGGVIASSTYYGAYPYYDEGYAYSDYCPSYGYGGYHPGYRTRYYDYGW